MSERIVYAFHKPDGVVIFVRITDYTDYGDYTDFLTAKNTKIYAKNAKKTDFPLFAGLQIPLRTNVGAY